jgi:D(-)-tartrate dehydratase
LLRDRFIPRLKSTKPESIVDDTGENLDPFRIWNVLMKNENLGGHGELSVAVGVLDMAVWDAVAKTLKFSIPRKVFSDVYGGQFHGPLVRRLVPEEE